MVSTKLFAAIATLALMAVATPIADPSTSELGKRAEAITISNVNSCTSDRTEPTCDQEPYVHFGAGNGSCKDEKAPFNGNFCSTFGVVGTPAGNAKWNKAASCSEKAKDGTAMGTLTAGKTVYHCVKATGKSSNDFGGIDYVGDVIMKCHT